jgi:hypothetical protein
MNNRHLYILAATLAVLGTAVFLYKVRVLDLPLTMGQEREVWTVEARITFEGKNDPVRLTLLLPRSTFRYSIINDAFISQGYGLSTSENEGNREAVWTIRTARGPQTIYYRAEVRQAERRQPPAKEKPPPPKSRLEGPELAAAQALLQEAQWKSADTESLVLALLKYLHQPQPDDNLKFLLNTRPAETDRIELAVQILALVGVSARSVHGLRLQESGERPRLLHWLEVFDRGRWRPFDFAAAKAGIADDYLAWWRGPSSLAQVRGGEGLQIGFSVSLDQEASIRLAGKGRAFKPALLKFSLFSLPLHTQQVYRVLLMVPVGAFLLVILRNVIGLSTFGTFMPVLIALAFRETRLLHGLALFSLLVGLGLLVRFYLDRLKLLLVPRLAAILIIVVLLMVAVSLAAHRLGIPQGLNIALFPMVIITMTIERMTIVWEERGPGEALKQGLGSLLAAAITYTVIHNRQVQHLIFVFPELLLLVLAATLLLGRYTGYRLVELHRFRAMLKERP